MIEKFSSITDQSIIKNLETLNNNIRQYIKNNSLILYYNSLSQYGKTYISQGFSPRQKILIDNYIKILDQANNIYFEKHFMAENPLLEEDEINFEEAFDSKDNVSIISEDDIFYHNIETTYDK